MAIPFDPDLYFHTGEWKNAVDPSKNHYERLGLKSGNEYSANDCKESFQQRYNWWREVNKRYSTNPANTKTRDTGPASREAMEKLHTAYAILSDPAKKASYDRLLKHEEDKKGKKEFLKMVNIVLSDGVLSQEGKKILFHCAGTPGIDISTALDIINSEMRRVGAIYKTESSVAFKKTFPDYYKTLGIASTASNDEIENAHKKRYFIWENLGRNSQFKNEAEQKKKQLQEAVDTLLDRKKRKVYDQRFKELSDVPVRAQNRRRNMLILAASGFGAMAVAVSAIFIVMQPGLPKVSKPSSLPPQYSGQGTKAASPVQVTKKTSASGWLGAHVQDITPGLAEVFDVTTTEGAVICGISENSPAKESGLECGDIIIEYDGKPVKHSNHLLYVVTRTEAGKTIKIKVLRNSKENEFYVKIGEQPPDKPVFDPTAIPYENDIGLTVQNITKEIARKFGIKETNGVIVSDIYDGGRASRSGIRRGDIINEIGREEVKDVAGLRRAFSKLDIKNAIRVHIKRDTMYLYIIIRE